MATRIKDGIIPYTGGQGIEITNNHVINVLLRELNNLIQVNGDRELYVDLQLPDGIQPSDTFPVGVTTGKILAEDGWQQSGIILNWKTTSGDYVRLIYANDGKLYYDPGTGVWRLLECDCNTRTFFIQSENDLTTMQQAIDYHDSGKDAILRLWDDSSGILWSELPGTFLFISTRFEESPTHPGGYTCYEFAEPITRFGSRRIVEIHKAFSTDPEYGEVAGQVFEIKVKYQKESYFHEIPNIGDNLKSLWENLNANEFYDKTYVTPEYFYKGDWSGSREARVITGMTIDSGGSTITADRNGQTMYVHCPYVDSTTSQDTDWICDSVEIKNQGATVDSTAPSNPTEGQLWYDTANATLNVYDGSSWQTV